MKPLTPLQKISLERMFRLFELADHAFEQYPLRAKRYIDLARKISKKSTIPLPTELKKQFCTACGNYLKAGTNAELIETDRWVDVHCRSCNNTTKRRK
jgi:ribonuclease P protein subunit RPR2